MNTSSSLLWSHLLTWDSIILLAWSLEPNNLESLLLPQLPNAFPALLDMSLQKPTGSRTLYLLPLTDDGAPDVPGEYIYLPPPSEPSYCVRFEIEGTSSICRQGSLWVNIPTPGQQFHREIYQEYKWVLLSYTSVCLYPNARDVQTAT